MNVNLCRYVTSTTVDYYVTRYLSDYHSNPLSVDAYFSFSSRKKSYFRELFSDLTIDEHAGYLDLPDYLQQDYLKFQKAFKSELFDRLFT